MKKFCPYNLIRNLFFRDTKISYFGGLWSFNVMNIGSLPQERLPTLLVKSNKYVLICNQSHDKRVISSKITIYGGFFGLRLKKILSPSGMTFGC